jgi:hydroxyacylglutathione hydrolase
MGRMRPGVSEVEPVKIGDRVHIVASGQAGFGLTDDFDCHVYLLDGGDEYALIDAGGGRDTAGILAQMRDDGLAPERVGKLLLTHAHADHAAGAAGLREQLGARVFASPLVARYVGAGDEQAISLDVARRAGVYPPDFVFRPCPIDGELVDGDEIQVGDLTLQVLETPGHSSGHLSFVLRRQGLVSVFCGDAVFCGGKILLQNIWDCSLRESIDSVERLASLSVDGLYPGHHAFAARRGRRHLEKAMRAIGDLLPPPQFS